VVDYKASEVEDMENDLGVEGTDLEDIDFVEDIVRKEAAPLYIRVNSTSSMQYEVLVAYSR
jgi:hypothetical protein